MHKKTLKTLRNLGLVVLVSLSADHTHLQASESTPTESCETYTFTMKKGLAPENIKYVTDHYKPTTECGKRLEAILLNKSLTVSCYQPRFKFTRTGKCSYTVK